MEVFNRREFLIRVGLVRPPMISAEQKARFVAACVGASPALDAGRDAETLRGMLALILFGSLAWIALVGAVVAWL